MESDLNAVEAKFGIYLPTEYRDQVLAVGLPNPTLALLSAIVDNEIYLAALSDLCNPKEIEEATIGGRAAGMPEDLLVIGLDHLANEFCFKLADLKTQRSAKAPIYFWDHDFLETEKVAASFTDWIDSYQGKWSEGVTYSDF